MMGGLLFGTSQWTLHASSFIVEGGSLVVDQVRVFSESGFEMKPGSTLVTTAGAELAVISFDITEGAYRFNDIRGYDGRFTSVMYADSFSPSEFASITLPAGTYISYPDEIGVVQMNTVELWAQSFGLDATSDWESFLVEDSSGDGIKNFEKIAFGGDPTLNEPAGYLFESAIYDYVDEGKYLTLTFPVLTDANYSGDGLSPTLSTVDLIYTLVAAEDLRDFDADALTIEEVNRDTTGLPALPQGYAYRSFRIGESMDTLDRGFMSIRLSVAD